MSKKDKQKKYFKIFADSRLLPQCVYCGERTENKDHIPAKVFLNQPYPENMDVLNSCLQCNGSASLDEEYVACLMEVVKVGSLDLDKLRPKIANSLRCQNKLLEMLKKDVVSCDPFEIKFDQERLHNVFLKLARGHAAHELSHFTLEAECVLSFSPFNKLTQDQIDKFHEPPQLELYPELGSRGMQRTYENMDNIIWIEVQEEQYYYMAFVNRGGSHVRISLSDYMAIHAFWPNS